MIYNSIVSSLKHALKVSNLKIRLMEFECDENKNLRNKKKHGIGFEDAKEVLKTAGE